jgi:hypothetical protein
MAKGNFSINLRITPEMVRWLDGAGRQRLTAQQLEEVHLGRRGARQAVILQLIEQAMTECHSRSRG